MKYEVKMPAMVTFFVEADPDEVLLQVQTIINQSREYHEGAVINVQSFGSCQLWFDDLDKTEIYEAEND